jgi:hypothetical protein
MCNTLRYGLKWEAAWYNEWHIHQTNKTNSVVSARKANYTHTSRNLNLHLICPDWAGKESFLDNKQKQLSMQKKKKKKKIFRIEKTIQ